MEIDEVVFKAINSILSQSNTFSIGNLEIVKQHLHMVYAVGFDHGKAKSAHGKSIIQYKDGIEVNRFCDMKSAGHSVGVTQSSISHNARGKSKTCKGFTFSLERTQEP